MYLNTIKPASGARQKAKRVGRGIGCGNGKTCGRGHKGQKSRSGASQRSGFEGGQMPLHRRLPKLGFKSRIGFKTAEIRLHELNSIESDLVDLAALKSANLIGANITRAKIILAGEIKKPLNIKGIRVTKGARAAIEKAGGKIEE